MRLAADWWKSKTFWTAGIGILTALGAAMTGELPWLAAIAVAFALLQTAFIRDAIARGHEGIRAEIAAHRHVLVCKQEDDFELLGQRIEDAVGSLREELASALQTTAENADRALTLAETIGAATQALAVTEPETDPIREAMDGNRRTKPPVFPQAGGLRP